jgi:hypothetical protein
MNVTADEHHQWHVFLRADPLNPRQLSRAGASARHLRRPRHGGDHQLDPAAMAGQQSDDEPGRQAAAA